jgi:ferritin-like metal-binding protein YciE
MYQASGWGHFNLEGRGREGGRFWPKHERHVCRRRIVKGAMASYTFEHMEASAYRVLIAAAEAAGDAQTKAVCERILQEELSMASDLERHLPDLTRRYLSRLSS